MKIHPIWQVGSKIIIFYMFFFVDGQKTLWKKGELDSNGASIVVTRVSAAEFGALRASPAWPGARGTWPPAALVSRRHHVHTFMASFESFFFTFYKVFWPSTIKNNIKNNIQFAKLDRFQNSTKIFKKCCWRFSAAFRQHLMFLAFPY